MPSNGTQSPFHLGSGSANGATATGEQLPPSTRSRTAPRRLPPFLSRVRDALRPTESSYWPPAIVAIAQSSPTQTSVEDLSSVGKAPEQSPSPPTDIPETAHAVDATEPSLSAVVAARPDVLSEPAESGATIPTAIESSLPQDYLQAQSSRPDDDVAVVCWDGIHIRRERNDASLAWTWSQINLAKNIDRDIAENVDFRSNRGDLLHELEYCLELLFAGHQPHHLRPAIVISTRSRRIKKRIIQSITRSDIRQSLRENGLDLFVVNTPIGPAAGPLSQTAVQVQQINQPLSQPRGWVNPAPPSASTERRGRRSSNLPSAQVVLADGATSLCGARILVKSSSPGAVSSCVLGGTVLVGDSVYAHTVLHPFVLDDAGGTGGLDVDGTWGHESDFEDDEADKAFYIMHDSDDYEDQRGSPLPSSSCSSSHHALECSQQPHIRRPVATATNPQIPAEDSRADFKVDGDHQLSPELDVLYQGPNADWAVFDASTLLGTNRNIDIMSANRIGGYAVTKCFDDASDVSVPVTIQLPTGETRGYFRPGPVWYRMGPRVYELRLVTLEEQQQPGCSGSWVACEDELCGPITVVRHDCPWVYIMPFTRIKQEMEDVCGGDVRFPPSLAGRPPSAASHLRWPPSWVKRWDLRKSCISVASTAASNAVPALNRDTSLGETSSNEADTDEASSVLGDGYILESQDGVLEVPVRYQENADLLCPFQILDCEKVFADIVHFKMHVFSHFRGHELPAVANCFLCDNRYGQEPTDDPALAWNSMLSHMVHDHFRKGQRLATVRTDFSLMRWMYSRRIITDHQFKRTQLTPVPIAIPHPFGHLGGLSSSRSRGIENLARSSTGPPTLSPNNSSASSGPPSATTAPRALRTPARVGSMEPFTVSAGSRQERRRRDATRMLVRSRSYM